MRRGIWIVVAAALAGLVLAACGGGGEDGDGPANTVGPGANKTFGEPGATVEVVEYFDYR